MDGGIEIHLVFAGDRTQRPVLGRQIPELELRMRAEHLSLEKGGSRLVVADVDRG